jgi:Asp-tRNA(Asn)/Glu-tRNA(Gln) amidotransferase A subunit family amidase
MPKAFNQLTACEASVLIHEKKIRSQDLVKACLARVAERDNVVHAWAGISPEMAIAQAHARDGEASRGPLHGIPIAIKDVIDTCDLPTEMGSPIFAGHQPRIDAAVVAQLRSAGAVLLGKTVTAEFAGMAPTITANPHNLAHTPGGSSSGSAAAVADAMVPIAFGTQTGGSVLRPASYCGVFGYKPTFGRINRAGLKFAAESIDTLGWMARSLEDIALVDGVLSAGSTDPLEARRPLRIGLCRTFMWDKALPETKEAIANADAKLQQAGIIVEAVELPADFTALTRFRQNINDYERVHGLAHEWAHHRAQISPELSASLRRGDALAESDYIAALKFSEHARVRLDQWMQPYDVLITPCVNGEAPKGLAFAGDPSFQALWTLLHVPVVCLPTHRGPKGLPVSIQLVGRRYGDTRLLQNALAIWSILKPSP